MQNINIIVIGGGNHHNALGVIRALGETGYGVELITIGNLKKHYVSSSRYVNRQHALKDVKELASFLLYRSIPADGNREIILKSATIIQYTIKGRFMSR